MARGGIDGGLSRASLCLCFALGCGSSGPGVVSTGAGDGDGDGDDAVLRSTIGDGDGVGNGDGDGDRDGDGSEDGVRFGDLASSFQTDGGVGQSGDGGPDAPAGPGDGVDADEPGAGLGHHVIDAEYAAAGDLLVTVSASPDALHVIDPETGEGASVELDLAPACVSVRPDGTLAAVGHDGWISLVDLHDGEVVDVLSVTADVFDVVLPDSGYVYAFPRTDQSETIRTLEIATGAETQSMGRAVWPGGVAKLHPDGTKMYGANRGVSPSDIERYSITDGVADVAYESPYHGEYAMCGDVWISEDGARLFTGCGNVFRSSDDMAQDMTYNGSLEDLDAELRHLDDSAETGKVAALADADVRFIDDPSVLSYVWLFDYEFLTLDRQIPMPRFTAPPAPVGGEPARGRFVFFDAEGGRLYLLFEPIAEADEMPETLLRAYDVDPGE